MKKNKFQTGFTMIELLIAIAVIAMLAVIAIFAFVGALQKGRDAERKKDLTKIRVAFEDYYNDNNCYPDVGVLSNCGEDFSPYLKEIPCDPISDLPYQYMPLADQCDGYRLFASLENEKDPDAINVGWGDEYNYGIASGTTVYDPDGSSGSGGAVGGVVYVYACDSAGTCNRYEEGHPALYSCPTTFENPGCNGQCGNSIYWCD
jgi:general secretion pathway protein G